MTHVPFYVPDRPDHRGLAVLGEAPGAMEARRGRPFVGESGRLLAKTLREAGVELDECFITNVVDVFRSGNPTPSLSEIVSNAPRVLQELRTWGCKRLLVLGGTALTCLGGKQGVTKARGQWFEVDGIRCMPTYHPAAVLRNARYFTAFAEDIQAWASGAELSVPKPTTLVVSKYQECIRWLAESKGQPIAFDIETTGLDPRVDALVSAAVSNGAVSLVFPLERLSWLSNVFATNECHVVGHNAIAFDLPFWKAKGMASPTLLADTMLLRYASGKPGPYDLKSLAKTLCGAPDYGIDPLNVLPEFLYEYLSSDAHYTWHLFQRLRDEMDSPAYRWIHDHALAVAKVQATGCLIDRDYLAMVERNLEKEGIDTRQEVPQFNPLSSQQVLAKMHEEGVHLTDTRAETLKMVGNDTASSVLKFRKVIKLLGIVRGLRERAEAAPDGRVRTSFLLHGTTTGRLASRDPNLQNIPRGPLIRQAFIAPPGWKILEADYSQLEFRVAAYLSRDERLIGHFRAGDDLHRMVAASAFGKREEDITPDERTIAKHMGFSILYGAGREKAAEFLRKETDMDPDACLEIAGSIFQRLRTDYKTLFAWIDKTAENGIKNQEVRTVFGRVRYFDLITDENIAEVRREAVNTPVQSTASDICLHALKTLVEHPLHGKLFRIILTVHDSIISEVHEKHHRTARLIIRSVMEQTPIALLRDVKIPWVVDVKISDAWGKENKNAVST